MFGSYYQHVSGKPIAGQPEIVKVPICCEPLLLNNQSFRKKVSYYERDSTIYNEIQRDEFEPIQMANKIGFRFDLNSEMIGLQPTYASYADPCMVVRKEPKPFAGKYGIM